MATKKTVTEQVPGLQQAPEGGKFIVRKATAPETDETSPDGATVSSYPHELVLVVPDEDEYVVPLYGYDDGTLTNATYQALAIRRETLRRQVFEKNDEVELTQ
jgi:hypothetical protein